MSRRLRGSWLRTLDVRDTLAVLGLLAVFGIAGTGCGATAEPDAGSSDAGSDGESGTLDAGPPDAPSLVGDWSEPPPYGAFMRFAADGTQRVARTRADLVATPIATGTWKLSGRRLTLENTSGACSTPPEQRVGTYDIDLAADSVTFAKVADACSSRNVIAGERWTRLP